MVKILSHAIEKKSELGNMLGVELYEFVLQIVLKEGDSALVDGGTELLVLFNNNEKDIISYAFVPKHNPSKPTISASLKESEQELVRLYCENVVNETI